VTRLGSIDGRKAECTKTAKVAVIEMGKDVLLRIDEVKYTIFLYLYTII